MHETLWQEVFQYVLLRGKSGGGLGLSVDEDDSMGLRITNIEDDSLACRKNGQIRIEAGYFPLIGMRWLEVGDCIDSINGNSDENSMREELRGSSVLHMTIRRDKHPATGSTAVPSTTDSESESGTRQPQEVVGKHQPKQSWLNDPRLMNLRVRISKIFDSLRRLDNESDEMNSLWNSLLKVGTAHKAMAEAMGLCESRREAFKRSDEWTREWTKLSVELDMTLQNLQKTGNAVLDEYLREDEALECRLFSSQERRVDPELDSAAVTYAEMCRKLNDQGLGLSQDQLREHWNNLKIAGEDGNFQQRAAASTPARCPFQDIRLTQGFPQASQPRSPPHYANAVDLERQRRRISENPPTIGRQTLLQKLQASCTPEEVASKARLRQVRIDAVHEAAHEAAQRLPPEPAARQTPIPQDARWDAWSVDEPARALGRHLQNSSTQSQPPLPPRTPVLQPQPPPPAAAVRPPVPPPPPGPPTSAASRSGYDPWMDADPWGGSQQTIVGTPSGPAMPQRQLCEDEHDRQVLNRGGNFIVAKRYAERGVGTGYLRLDVNQLVEVGAGSLAPGEPGNAYSHYVYGSIRSESSLETRGWFPTAILERRW